MNRLRFFFLLFILATLSFAQVPGNATTEGGNISDVNLASETNSTWHGVCGQASPSAAVPVIINATPQNITSLTINTGSGSYPYGVSAIYLLFSTSPTAITSLQRGNLTALDTFINRSGQNGTETFVFSTTFTIGSYGTITGVPTTYTRAPLPTTFPLGYLRDQAGNFVFVTQVVSDQAGFNGSTFDFQLMLPTNNGTPTLYYLTVVVVPNPSPVPPTPPGPPTGGGGTRTPYYNVTPPVAYECYSDADCPVGKYCRIIPGQAGGVCLTSPPSPACDVILYCTEWGPCTEDGYRYQPCTDLANCSNITVYRVEKCPAVLPVFPPVVPEEIITIIIQPGCPCLPLLLLALLITAIIYILRRRTLQKGEDSG